MQKSAPSIWRITAMVLFSLSCFGILTFLWVSFGGPVPLKAKRYELKANFPEAATLAEQADVRIAGVNVGKVQSMQLDKGAARETAVLSIDSRYAPLPRDTKAILRQKTLLGETYVELTPGSRTSGTLQDGTTLSNATVIPTVTLDQILRIFDPKTRDAFRAWVASSARQIRGTAPQDLNDALGNLAPFAQNGAGVLQVLDTQSTALRQLVHNTGVVFGALNERQGQLAQLVVNSNATFQALSSEQRALADTFRVFPTFLDQSRTTLARLQTFSANTLPLVNELRAPGGVADRLPPTLADLGALAPDLRDLFIRLKPVVAASGDLQQAARFIRGASPVFNGLHVFLPQLNPVISYINYDQALLAGFITNGGASFHYKQASQGDGVPRLALAQFGIINNHSLGLQHQVPNWARGNAYDLPDWYPRAVPMGIIESFSCRNTTHGGEQRDPNPNDAGGATPPCFVQPPQLYSGTQYTFLTKGDVYRKPSPRGTLAGNPPANPNRPLTFGR